MLTEVVGVPPEFIIPVIVPLEVFVKVSAPPDAFPSRLLLIFIDEVAAPEFEIPINAPLAAVLV